MTGPQQDNTLPAEIDDAALDGITGGMNKGELIEWLYENEAAETKAQAERILTSVLDDVKKGLGSGSALATPATLIAGAPAVKTGGTSE